MCNHYICTLVVNIKLQFNIHPTNSFGKTNDKLRLTHVNEKSPNNQLGCLSGLIAEKLTKVNVRRYTPLI